MTGLGRSISRLEGKFLALYGRVVHTTARFSVSGLEHLTGAMDGPNPTILSAWHGQNHPLLGYLSGVFDMSKVVLIIPDDHRRQVLESFIESVGASTFAVSMADESFAGARRLLQLIRALRERGLSFIAPDGPDGPARVPKPGIAFVAEKAGAQVVPVGAAVRPCLRQNRWDRYILPFPFAKVSIAFRPAFAAAPAAEREGWMRRLTHELTAAIEEAVANLRNS